MVGGKRDETHIRATKPRDDTRLKVEVSESEVYA